MTDSFEVGPPRWVLWWAAFVGIVVILAAGFVVVRAQNATDLAKQNTTILEAVRQSETQRDAQARQDKLAFAVILENLASVFDAPPAPDPGRLKAVRGLCDTARSFRLAAGDLHPPMCPSP